MSLACCLRCCRRPPVAVDGLPIDYCQECYDEWLEADQIRASARVQLLPADDLGDSGVRESRGESDGAQ